MVLEGLGGPILEFLWIISTVSLAFFLDLATCGLSSPGLKVSMVNFLDMVVAGLDPFFPRTTVMPSPCSVKM